MRKTILSFFAVIIVCKAHSQNLVVNPDAESLPRGMGWTIINQGALTCASYPTTNYLNWTIKPDGTYNYPFDHTTGAAGGTIFFSGCDTYLQGPFELQQTIDISSDAANIDLGNGVYSFEGYMQTPVSNQSDRGRFIIDFVNASNTVLGTSYTSNWQSELGGSGIGWVHYTNTRLAPAGTRKVTIRLQTQLYFNQPAINVYFDDISFSKLIVLPLHLLSFTGKTIGETIQLNWQMEDAQDCRKIELQRSADGNQFGNIATVPGGNSSNRFTDETTSDHYDKYFYRLKMTGNDGKITYSDVLMIRNTKTPALSLSPNPAGNAVTVNGLFEPGNVSVINYSGSTMLSVNTNTASVNLDIAKLPAGLYIVRFTYQKNSINKKLVIKDK